MAVPNIYHFCYFGGRPLGWIEYLAVLSCYKVNSPEKIYFYTDSELAGEWWEKILPMVEVEKVAPINEAFGVAVPYPAHKADILRLYKLIERGGVYLDLDVVCRRPFAPLFDHRVVLGQELVAGNLVGLCNAVVLAQPGEQFLQRWLEGFDPQKSLWRGFRSSGPQDKYYSEISIKYSHFLANYWPEEVHVEPVSSFFSPTYEGGEMKKFFEDSDTGAFDQSYCHHLWSVAKKTYLDGKTLEQIASPETAFGKLVQNLVK